MLLTSSDVERITTNTRLKIEDFAFMNDEGWYQLKNVNGHCVFLDERTNRCVINDFKPAGCRVYPIIFDVDQHQCVLDDETCPFSGLISAEEIKINCHRTRQIIHELTRRDWVGR